jgi:hypothetical protein
MKRYVVYGNGVEYGRWATRKEASDFIAIQVRKIKGAGLAKNPVTSIEEQAHAAAMTWKIKDDGGS